MAIYVATVCALAAVEDTKFDTVATLPVAM